jgi:hypothetical protein
LFRSSNPNATAGLTVSLGFPAGVSNGNAFLDTRLLIQYYTRQPSDLVPARNVVPYAEYPRYITNVSGTIPASTQAPGVVAGADFALVPGAFPTIESNSISLNQIPDKILIFVRKRLASGICGECRWNQEATKLGQSLAVLLFAVSPINPSAKSPPVVRFLPYLWVSTLS